MYRHYPTAVCVVGDDTNWLSVRGFNAMGRSAGAQRDPTYLYRLGTDAAS